MAGPTDCPNCGAPANAPARVGGLITCRYCKHTFQDPRTPPPAARSGGGGGGIPASEAPIPQKGKDPLGGLVTKGIWSSIRTGHNLVHLGRDRLLDWEPSTGSFHVWIYDNTIANADPLPRAQAEGQWSSIGSGHELIYVGNDQILDWEPGSGAYRVWHYDRNARGNQDVIPTCLTKGTWQSIQSSKKLIPLGKDHILDWEPASGAYRVWHFDRNANGGDPLPGGPITQGEWSSIRHEHELVWCGGDYVLDWVPGSGNYRLWFYDRNARGSGDPFPREVAAGNWASIRQGHELINLDGARILDWEPDSGAYRLWGFQT